MLFGDASPENTDRIARGHAVMAHIQRGRGTVFNAGSANWCYGLGADPMIEQIRPIPYGKAAILGRSPQRWNGALV